MSSFIAMTDPAFSRTTVTLRYSRFPGEWLPLCFFAVHHGDGCWMALIRGDSVLFLTILRALPLCLSAPNDAILL